jgi:hypothetical protein
MGASMNRLADEHIQAVEKTIDELIIGKYGVNETARHLRNLGYNHDEAWEMVHKHAPKPKVVKIT